MAPNNPDKFTRCFADFVNYLNVVEPYYMQSGVLDVRIGISSDDSGGLHFWVQQCVCMPDAHDNQRFQRIFARIDNLVRDLNFCRSFVDDKIVHTYELFDQEGDLRFMVVRGGLAGDNDD
ncbi:hypothetical protein [Gordonibacter pamelaeae]